MIKAVIFDLWSTLGGKHTSVSRRLFARFGIPRSRATSVQYERAVQLRKWRSMDRMAKAFLHAFGLPCRKDNVAAVKRAFQYAIEHATPFPGVKGLLKMLRGQYKIGLLSNTTVFESTVVSRWGLDPYFDCQVYSWQLGAIKPSRKNFEAVRRHLGCRFDECLLVDDNKINVAAARSLGMKVIHFVNVENLEAELKRKGVGIR